MAHPMRLLSLLLGLAVFFVLFAFAVNNGEPATVLAYEPSTQTQRD